MDEHVFQENEAYCGPAVVQLVLRRFGVELAQRDIAKELETDMVVGTSASELQKFFEKRGLAVERKNNATWEELQTAPARGVAIVGYIEPEGDPHYAVVKSADHQAITLADPWHGDDFVLPKEEFLKRWVDNEPAQYGTAMLMLVRKKAVEFETGASGRD